MMRPFAALVLIAMIAGTAGCGARPPQYHEATACGVNSTLVEAIIGSDRFYVAVDGSELPLQHSTVDVQRHVCEIYEEKDGPALIEVSYSLLGAGTIEGVDESIRGADTTFDVAGGSAGLTTNSNADVGAEGMGFTAWWACSARPITGAPTLYANGEAKTGTRDELIEMVGKLAAAARCGDPQP